MQRISDIVGKTIVSAATGEKVGQVADVLVNEAGTRLVGLVIGGGLLGSEHVLPYEDVQTLGKDAVVARSADRLMEPREWHNQHSSGSRSSAIRNRRVITSTGRQLGSVKDLRVNEHTGTVEGYEIGTGGLRSKRRIVPQSGGLTIGPDAVIVSESHADAASETDEVAASEEHAEAEARHDEEPRTEHR